MIAFIRGKSIVPLFSALERRRWCKKRCEKILLEITALTSETTTRQHRPGKLSERSRNGQVDVPCFCILGNFVIAHILYEVLFINYAGERSIFFFLFAGTRSRAGPFLRTIAIRRDSFSIHGFYSCYVSMFEENRGESEAAV